MGRGKQAKSATTKKPKNHVSGNSPMPGCLDWGCRLELLGLHTYSVTAFCFGHRVCLSAICLSCVRSRKLCEIRAKFRHP